VSHAAFNRLLLLLWLVIGGIVLYLRWHHAWTGENWDTDDAMRLTQAIDLVAGQGWSDLTQHRLNPPAGVVMHWSRLADLPLAAVIATLGLALPLREAATIAAIGVPMLYMAAYIFVFGQLGRFLLGRARAPIMVLACALTSTTIFQFAPGRVDHHGLQVLCNLAALALLLPALASRRCAGWLNWAAAPIVASLWIGNEGLPFLAAYMAIFAWAWVVSGGDLMRRAAGLMALTACGAGAALLLSAPPGSLTVASCDAFSIFSVAILLAAALVGSATHWLGGRLKEGPWRRAATGAVCATVAIAVLLTVFPECAGGGYGAVDPLVAERWLSKVSEAQPLRAFAVDKPFQALSFTFNPAIALIYCAWAASIGSPRRRIAWLSLGACLAVAVALMFWQVRTAHYAQALAVPAIAALIARCWGFIEGRLRQPQLLLARMATLLVLMPSVWGVAKAGVDHLREASDGVREQQAESSSGCRSRASMSGLAAMRPGLVLSYIDLGPTILFNTGHSVIAAPYHRNGAGLRFAIDVFSSTDDSLAERTLRERGVSLLAVCVDSVERQIYARASEDSLSDRLSRNRAPDWLTAVPEAGTASLQVFRLNPQAR